MSSPLDFRLDTGVSLVMFEIIEHVVFAVLDLGFHPMRRADALYRNSMIKTGVRVITD